MFTSFFRFSALMIVLLCNETIFGMISSTPQLNFFSQKTDVIKNEIIPLLSGSDRLNLRLTCTTLANNQLLLANDQQFYDIYNQYNDEKKQITSSCAFLDCINKGKYQEVKWFLKNEIHNPLFHITYNHYNHIEYWAINPFKLIKADDLTMKKLFATYHYDEEKFVESLKRIQEKYCVPVKLNEKLQEWQRASNDKNIHGGKIDPTSNVYKNTISAKERIKEELFCLIQTDCSSQLILAACIGDMNCFNQAMIDYENKNNNHSEKISYGDARSIRCNILLSIVAAFKNKDLDLIKFILKQPLYVKHMESDIIGLLSYFLLNTPVENSAKIKISKDKCFDDRHIQWIKQLIQEGMFTRIPKMIEKNKDNNKHIEEIYKTLCRNRRDQ